MQIEQSSQPGRPAAAKAASAAIFVALSLLLLGGGAVLREAAELPEDPGALSRLIEDALPLATEIYDRHGEKIGEFAGERRYFVPLAEIPETVVRAFLSAEDQDFYEHHGISARGVLRSLVANLRGLRLKQGGSTITQQVARAYYLTREKTWSRKIKEAILALTMERRLTKAQILELYLNKIFLGNRSYGVEAAARNYFRKSIKDVTIGEAALLASLPKGPSLYAPHRHYKRARARQSWVLRRMAEDGFITAETANRWRQKPVRVAKSAQDLSARAPYFVAAVRSELRRKFETASLPRSGLKVFTTLDIRAQRAAEKHLAAAVREARGGHGGRIEGALVSIDPATGDVLALQGGRSFRESQFDRARLTSRAVGGLIMPIYAALALERGYELTSPVDFDPLAPGRSRSEAQISLYEAVVDGRLIDGARIFTALGAGSVRRFAARLGLPFAGMARQDDVLLALGYGDATPRDLALAYSAFANGGMRRTPSLVMRIDDANGRTFYRSQPEAGDEVMAPEAAALTTSLLQHAARYGQQHDLVAAALRVHPEAGGIAGVSEDLHNAWYVGMQPEAVTAVWVGAERGSVRVAVDENAATRLAASVWAGYAAETPRTGRVFPGADQMSYRRYSLRSGTAASGAAEVRSLPFVARRAAALGDVVAPF
jgi:membrane peptidoglycan carboxypeptidase